jgi:hypothetical protein
MTALPAKYFAVGPYRAEQVGPAWWGVMNKSGVNVLTFAEKPGAVVTDEWNSRTEAFVYPADSYVAPVTTRWTDDQMAEHIRNRRYNFETKVWK